MALPSSKQFAISEEEWHDLSGIQWRPNDLIFDFMICSNTICLYFQTTFNDIFIVSVPVHFPVQIPKIVLD